MPHGLFTDVQRHLDIATKAGERKPSRNAVNVTVRGEKDKVDDATARTLTRPEVNSAVLVQQLEGDNHEVNAVIRWKSRTRARLLLYGRRT